MRLVACKVCGSNVAPDADICPGCGTKDPHGKIFIGRIVGLVMMIAGGLYFWFSVLPGFSNNIG